jgi:hypothetical protein
MGVLYDLSTEAWDVLVTYLQSWHIGRLLLTGDTIITSRICSTRRREFDAPPPSRIHMLRHKKLSPITDIAFAYARSIKLECPQLGFIRQTEMTDNHLPFTCLVKVEVRCEPQTKHTFLRTNDFSWLSSMQVLKIRGYTISRTLHLPLSVTSISASHFDADSYRLDFPIAGVGKLSNLVRLRLKMSSKGVLVCAVPKWPSVLQSLAVPFANVLVSSLPASLTKLRIWSRLLDIYDLVTMCPSLSTLRVSGDATISSPLPPGLKTLIVNRFVSPTNELAIDLFARLPSTIGQVRFGQVLCEGLRELANYYLPKLGFADLDNACRALLRSDRGISTIDDALFPHVLPWMNNDYAKTFIYIHAAKYACTEARGSKYLTKKVDAKYLCNLAQKLGDDLCRKLFPHLLKGCVVRGHYTNVTTERSTSTELTLLEVGVMDSLYLVDDCPPLKLSDTQCRNLSRVEIRSDFQGLVLLTELLSNNNLPSLSRIDIRARDDNFVGIAATLARNKLNMPRLETVHCWSARDLSEGQVGRKATEVIETMGKLRLYQKRRLSDLTVLFVYRVTPPQLSLQKT